MEPIIIQFQRGLKLFEAIITDRSCILKDLEDDVRFSLPYKFEITQLIINAGENPSIQVRYKTGLETATGALVNVVEGSWSFNADHPDFIYFIENYGLKFMGSSLNGFVKHMMANDPRYIGLVSQFLAVLDDNGNYVNANND